jgi:hypothetical protein
MHLTDGAVIALAGMTTAATTVARAAEAQVV